VPECAAKAGGVREAQVEGVDVVSGSVRNMATNYAISNGFGFGGVNASLVFGRL
jgi:3-oxoacyl-[acyl-carrier-protein] synthase II